MPTTYRSRMDRRTRETKLSVFLSSTKSEAENKSSDEIIKLVNLNKKIIHISLTESKDEMYRRIFKQLVETNIGEILSDGSIKNSLISKDEQNALMVVVNNLINNLVYVCFDTLDICRINELLRVNNYDEIIVTSTRYDRTIKRKCSILRKSFNIDVQLNLFPTRKII